MVLVKKATGLDGVSARLLKYEGVSIAPSLKFDLDYLFQAFAQPH